MKRIIPILICGLSLACSLPPEYKVKNQLYPNASGYSSKTEEGYSFFRIKGHEALMGYLLSLNDQDGLIFLKVTPDGILESALLYHEAADGETKKTPIYQSDWNQELKRVAERPHLYPMVSHFLTNHYQADQVTKRGSAFSIF